MESSVPTARSDMEWVAALADHRVGRLLSSHLASVEARSSARSHDCAVQEALGNERVFVHALTRSVNNKRPFPCGLSSQLPRFIAVLNLSGERSVVCSESASLLRCICSHSSVLHRNELQEFLAALETFPMTRTSTSMKFVLLTYSLPWQSGTDSAFWHLSACSINTGSGTGMVNPTVSDRILQFSSASVAPFVGKSVMDVRDARIQLSVSTPSKTLDMVSEKQVVDFSESYSATCLDKTPTLNSSVEVDGKSAQMRSLNHQLARERKRDQDELRVLKIQVKECEACMASLEHQCDRREKDVVETHKTEICTVLAKADEKLSMAREQHEALCVEMKSMETSQREIAKENRKAKKVHEVLTAKHNETVRQSAAKDALNNAALSNHVRTISRLEGLLATDLEKAASIRSDLEREHSARLENEHGIHTAAMSKVLESLESKKRIINQLSENNERRDVEVASLKTHEEEQKQRICDLEAETKSLREKMALAVNRKSETTTVAKTSTKTASTSTRKTASTSTHHCASTQTRTHTQKLSLEEPITTAMGAAVVDNVPPPVLSYQNAVNMLQELVVLSGNAPVAQMAMPPQVYTHPHPLPFPHFTPNGVYHFDPNGHMRQQLPQFPQNYRH